MKLLSLDLYISRSDCLYKLSFILYKTLNTYLSCGIILRLLMPKNLNESSCYNRWFPMSITGNTSEYLKLHTLCKRLNHLDELFFIQVYLGFKSVLLFWELLVQEPLLGTSPFFLFNVRPSNKNYPPSKCAIAANVCCRDFDIFNTKKNKKTHSLTFYITMLLYIFY